MKTPVEVVFILHPSAFILRSPPSFLISQRLTRLQHMLNPRLGLLRGEQLHEILALKIEIPLLVHQTARLDIPAADHRRNLAVFEAGAMSEDGSEACGTGAFGNQLLRFDQQLDGAFDRILINQEDVGDQLLHNYARQIARRFDSDAFGNGSPTRFEYDALNRKVKQFDAFNKATIYTYDANGNLLKETDRNGYPKSYAYDVLNRRISETDALSHTTQFKYDADGNLGRVFGVGTVVSNRRHRITSEALAGLLGERSSKSSHHRRDESS